MDNDIKERFDRIEKKIETKQKDTWDKLQSVATVLIPIVIAILGWHYTNENSKSQLAVQQLNNDNQSQIGQSELIKDFMPHLTSPDSTTRNIAIEAILYAAPQPGKKIVEALSRTSNKQTRQFAIDALAGKRMELASNIFSDQKQARIIAVNEVAINWFNDDQMLNELLNKAKGCFLNNDTSISCTEGIYNLFIVLPSFSKQLLIDAKPSILSIANQIRPENIKTKKLAADFLTREF